MSCEDVKIGKTMTKRKLIVLVVAVVVVALGIVLILSRGSKITPASTGVPVRQTPPIIPAVTSSSSAPTSTPVALAKVPSRRWESKFSYPYPVSWDESWEKIYNGHNWGNFKASFALTGVSVGTTTLQATTYMPPVPYKAGDEVYAIIFIFKIATIDTHNHEGGDCVHQNVRRIVNEAGDLSTPLEPMWYSQGGCLSVLDATYDNVKLTFVVPESEQPFSFTSGGKSNIFFEVSMSDDGGVNVGLEPTSEGG